MFNVCWRQITVQIELPKFLRLTKKSIVSNWLRTLRSRYSHDFRITHLPSAISSILDIRRKKNAFVSHVRPRTTALLTWIARATKLGATFLRAAALIATAATLSQWTFPHHNNRFRSRSRYFSIPTFHVDIQHESKSRVGVDPCEQKNSSMLHTAGNL